MTVLPIAERELRVAARSVRTYWSRALTAMVVVGVTVAIFASSQAKWRSRSDHDHPDEH